MDNLRPLENRILISSAAIITALINVFLIIRRPVVVQKCGPVL